MQPGCSMLLISPAQALLQTDKPVAPDNNVIHQVNIEKFRGLHQLFSHSDVLWRRRWISTRMIVTDDYGGAVANNSRTKYFGRAQYRTIDRPLVAIDILYNLVFCIENQDAHLFMVKVHHFWHHQVRSVSRRFYLILLLVLQHTQAPPYLQCSLQL